MPKYATQTTVAVASSKSEIERILMRYGADQFMQGWDAERAVIGFRIQSRQIRMFLIMPDKNADAFKFTEAGRERSLNSQYDAYEQACRQRWRALSLVIKAKLEAVECSISTVEKEFMGDTVMPNGMTVHEWAEPQIREMYLTGQMPPLLPSPSQLRITG